MRSPTLALTTLGALLLVAGLAVARDAAAQPPPCAPPYGGSTKSSNCIRLVGRNGGVPDPAGTFVVTVRDCVPNLLAGVTVTFDFSNCPDVHVGVQVDQLPGTTVDGATRTVSRTTDGSGSTTFDILGGVNPATRGTPSAANCAKLYADGVLLSNVSVEAFDQDGISGVELADLALWASDFYSALNQRRSDYDCNASVALPDLSIWAADYFSHQGQSSAATYAW